MSTDESKLSIKEQACHSFALSGSGDTQLNKNYHSLCSVLGAFLGYGKLKIENNTFFSVSNQDVKSNTFLRDTREQSMTAIIKLCDPHEVKMDGIKLCAGFNEGQVFPEHLWLEDHNNKLTHDTFNNVDVVTIEEVGKDGEDFKPGCESTPFKSHQIVRVDVEGFTKGQWEHLRDYYHKNVNDINSSLKL